MYRPHTFAVAANLLDSLVPVLDKVAATSHATSWRSGDADSPRAAPRIPRLGFGDRMRPGTGQLAVREDIAVDETARRKFGLLLLRVMQWLSSKPPVRNFGLRNAK